jgi:UDP-N-acetylglucosamine 2-epimerase (non-hydrolysing)
MKIACIVGTRPNFMKVAPLIEEFRKHKIDHVLIHTGQHYDSELSRLFFDDLGLPKPDENLGVKSEQKILEEAIAVSLEKHKPDMVVVVGDVNSTVAGAKAAHRLGMKVAHVEAGLRSFDKTMPEELNRIETDKISDFLFTTEKSGNENLEKESVGGRIFFVGNVMIDALLGHKKKSSQSEILEKLNIKKNNYCVLTLHRPSNVDIMENFENVISIVENIQKKIKIVFPIHPRATKNIEKFNLKGKIESLNNLIVTKPLGYLDFLWLMANSRFVLTDSGGIQEETTVLGLPCITLRNNTERPVTVEQGTNILVSTDKSKVVEAAHKIIEGFDVKGRVPELWDGNAAKRIVEAIMKNFD